DHCRRRTARRRSWPDPRRPVGACSARSWGRAPALVAGRPARRGAM
ncbi:MAG: hypothetical protein AVDCRST_MAG32-2571, partial [uncultured Nocardioides sp.]